MDIFISWINININETWIKSFKFEYTGTSHLNTTLHIAVKLNNDTCCQVITETRITRKIY